MIKNRRYNENGIAIGTAGTPNVRSSSSSSNNNSNISSALGEDTSKTNKGQRRLIFPSAFSTKVLIIALAMFVVAVQLKSTAKEVKSRSGGKELLGFAPPVDIALRDNNLGRDGSHTLKEKGEDNMSHGISGASSSNQGSGGSNGKGGNNGLRFAKWENQHDAKDGADAKNNEQTSNANQQQQQQKKQHLSKSPRIIAIQYTSHGTLNAIIIPHATTPFEKLQPLPQEGPHPTPDWYKPNAIDHVDGYDLESCEPMYEWQLKSFSNCNKFHEVDWFQLRMINSGGSRTAFEMNQHINGETTKYVYKTMKYGKNVDDYHIEQQRRDSLVMERTSGSKFIPDIWGYCSLAVMMDFMPEGNMHDYIKGSRIAGGSKLPPVDKLRIAIHIASSVADLHTIDETKAPSIFHNDICCHQYLFQDGVFKLNDFNYARPIYVNKDTKEQCTREKLGMVIWKGRSLEEWQRSLGHPDFKPFKPDVVDVWMMGDVIYIILTDLYTFEKPKNLSGEESGKKLVAGERTPYPDHIDKSNDPSYVAIKKALDMCWTHDWRERPSARSISDYMMEQLREITGDKNPDLRVTLPGRNKKQRPTDSDFNHYND